MEDNTQQPERADKKDAPGAPEGGGDPSAAALTFEAPVTEVTLLEDRAQVVRAGAADLPAGRVKVCVEGVAPVLADKTLVGEVASGPEGARVADVRARRELRRTAKKRPALVAGIEADIESLEGELLLARRGAAILKQELRGVTEAAEGLAREMSADVAWGRAEPDEWREKLDALSRRERSLREEALAAERRASEIDEKLTDCRFDRDILLTPASGLGTAIEAELHVETPGRYELRFAYLVPGACWRPRHTARLERTPGGERIAFETDASVWQNTGEDWRDARLVFSTERASLGAEAPLLEADVLQARDRPEKLVVETREREIETTGLGRAAAREAEEVPGIDDAGEPQAFESLEPATVPSDGRPYRVGIVRFEADAETKLVAFPELAEAVIRKCELANASARPVLAGPVDLVAESGHVGRTSVLYAAPGERFSLGFGPDPEIRVHRRYDVVQHEEGMLSRWKKTDRSVAVALSNIGAATKSFEVTERVPVSEVEQVKITFDAEKSSPSEDGPARPSPEGLVTWRVELPPGGHSELRLRYAVEKHKDVAGI